MPPTVHTPARGYPERDEHYRKREMMNTGTMITASVRIACRFLKSCSTLIGDMLNTPCVLPRCHNRIYKRIVARMWWSHEGKRSLLVGRMLQRGPS